jgi:Glycosyl transferase family 2
VNDASPQTSSIVARALSALSELVSVDTGRSTDWRELGAVLPSLPARPTALPADVIVSSERRAGPEWHANQLLRLGRTDGQACAADDARRRYHARMLGHILAPDREEFRPLVTVLIPVFNRAGPLVEAVQSCIDQTWRPLEILVIDDGSTDDPAAALAPFGAQVRLISKPNGGVASARNLGLRMAQGDFIHLLDSDDLLCPTAIESKIAAFMAAADADLCYGQSQWIDMRTSPPRVKELRHHELHNPVRSMIVEFAFPVPAVMMPRWRMLATPAFEEDLRRSSDFRYWQQLGFAGITVIGIRTQSAFLRRFEHSLQATPHPEDDSHSVALLRGLRDLIRHPHAWPYAVEYMNIITTERARHWFGAMRSERIHSALSELVSALKESSAPIGAERLSALPMLVALNGRINQLKAQAYWPDQDPASVYRVVAAAIAQAIATAPPLSERDLAFWARDPEVPLRYQGLHRFFAGIGRQAPRHAARLADTLLRHARAVPNGASTKVATRLRPFIGVRFAGMAAARWVQRKAD